MVSDWVLKRGEGGPYCLNVMDAEDASASASAPTSAFVVFSVIVSR